MADRSKAITWTAGGLSLIRTRAANQACVTLAAKQVDALSCSPEELLFSHVFDGEAIHDSSAVEQFSKLPDTSQRSNSKYEKRFWRLRIRPRRREDCRHQFGEAANPVSRRKPAEHLVLTFQA